MKESIFSIAQWHEKTFPDATLETQIEKFHDELNEFDDAIEYTDNLHDAFVELADCAIVACGLCRWGMAGANAFAKVVYLAHNMRGFTDNDPDPVQLLLSAIDAKMEINRKRKWNNDHGKYQHIEDGGK